MKSKNEFKNGWWLQFKRPLAVKSGVLLLCLAAASSTAQTYFVLHNFIISEGDEPTVNVVLSNATLYGTTYQGGCCGLGTVFKVNTDGTGFTVFKHYTGSDGSYPLGLVLSGTTLYGTTDEGGVSNCGTVFKLNTDGNGYTVLKQFTNSNEGLYPNGDLVLSGTTLYGTTEGGVSNCGTIFKLSTDGSGYTVLKRFTNSSKWVYPNGGLVLSGTTLYGTTDSGGVSNCGTVFKLNTDGSGYTAVKQFTNTSNGRLMMAVPVVMETEAQSATSAP